MMLTDAAAAPNNQIQLAAAVSVTWNPFSAPSLPPARCQLIFALESTFKALNIIHYNALHSCGCSSGMRQVQNSPRLTRCQILKSR